MVRAGFFDLVDQNFRTLPVMLLSVVAILVLFLLGALAYYFLVEVWRAGAKPGVREFFAYVFPRKLYRSTTMRSDFWNFWFVNLIWFPVVSAVLTIAGTVTSGEATRVALDALAGARAPVLHDPSMIVTLQVVALFLGAEFGGYLAHLMLHKVPILWSIHRVHHSAEALTIFTRLRDHPLDLLFLPPAGVIGGGLAGGLVLYLTGTQLQPTSVAIYTTIRTVIPFGPDLWRHCHLPISFGPLNHVFNAPVMHQIHHSAEPRHFDKNLGGELMIFDWICGTLYVPRGPEDYRWGLNDRELGENNPHATVMGFYLEPFRHAFARLRGARAENKVQVNDETEMPTLNPDGNRLEIVGAAKK